MPLLLFTNYKSLHPLMGCTHHTLYFIKLPIELQKPYQFCLKHSNLAAYRIYVLCKIKYPIASGGLRPPDPLLQRYNSRISPSPQEILDPPLQVATSDTINIVTLEHKGTHGYIDCNNINSTQLATYQKVSCKETLQYMIPLAITCSLCINTPLHFKLCYS